MVTEPDLPPLDALTSVCPGASAVTTPALLTDATDGSELFHVMTALVTGELEELYAVAVNVVFVPTVSDVVVAVRMTDEIPLTGSTVSLQAARPNARTRNASFLTDRCLVDCGGLRSVGTARSATTSGTHAGPRPPDRVHRRAK